MRVDKQFAPKVIYIDSEEDYKFIFELIVCSQEYIYNANRWSSMNKQDKDFLEKIKIFENLLK